MSDLNNPLFENQKEFLERHKQEYKNSLLSDVSELKTQSQKVGKTILIAGAGLAGVLMIGSMFRSKKKDKVPKVLKAKPTYLTLPVAGTSTLSASEVVNPDGSLNYADAILHTQPVTETYYYQHTPETNPKEKESGSFFQSDMVKALSQQITAFALVYLTKKLEEYLVDSKNTDIAASKVTETKDIDFSYHEEDAV